MDKSYDDLARYLDEAVSERLGRPAHRRKVKNQNQWWITDPVFSFVQHGMRKGQTGYRAGYFLSAMGSPFIAFFLVHSPLLAALFKRNLVFSTLTSVLEQTQDYRRQHRVHWSSRFASVNVNPNVCVESRDHDEVIDVLRNFNRKFGFVDDLFPRVPNRGVSGGKAPVAGNDFFVRLADKVSRIGTRGGIQKLVDLSWPLFLCLYPVSAIEKRCASLARALKSLKLEHRCEFSRIRKPRSHGLSLECRGTLQAAHIKPHSRGGSDRPENGLWLCEFHHRLTEGKLEGHRGRTEINVQYVG